MLKNKMKTLKISFLIGLLICLLFIGSVSADTYEETFEDSVYVYNGMTSSCVNWPKNVYLNNLYIAEASPAAATTGLYFYTFESGNSADLLETDIVDAKVTFFNDSGKTNEIGTGTFNARSTYTTGAKSGFDIWIFFDDFDNNQITSNYVPFTVTGGNPHLYSYCHQGSITTNTNADGLTMGICAASVVYGDHQTVIKDDWEQSLSIETDNYYLNMVTLIRNYKYSELYIYDESEATLKYDYNYFDLDSYVKGIPYSIKLTNPYGTVFERDLLLDSDIIETINVLTHVFSTADNSLIGGATVTYNATDGSGDNQTKTLATGEGIFVLQHGVTYDFFAEAEGYSMQIGSTPQPSFYGDTQFAVYMSPAAAAGSGNGILNFQVFYYTDSGEVFPLENAIIEIENTTLITNAAGYDQYEIDKNSTISYSVKKDGYVSFSRSYVPAWVTDSIDEWIYIREVGQTLPGEPTAIPTTDTRTGNEKAEASFDIVFDNLEAIASLCVLVVIFGLFEMIGGGGKKR
jgi:hypothetical protein